MVLTPVMLKIKQRIEFLEWWDKELPEDFVNLAELEFYQGRYKQLHDKENGVSKNVVQPSIFWPGKVEACC